jgi:uncharacterized membrane protein
MSRWSVAAERNREMVAGNAERILNDTTYDRLRTPRSQRLLVAACIAMTIAIPCCWLLGGRIAGILAVLVAIVVYLLLRVSVRGIADLPDHVLDERMRRERDSVYVVSFRTVSTVVMVAMNIAFIAVEFGEEDATISFDGDAVNAVYWTLLAVVLGTPSVVMALRQATDAE